jgi:hypothetical protein
MRLVSLRVVVAADDGAELADIKVRLQKLIRQAGTEGAADLEGEALIFWSTADVLQGPERVAARGKVKPAKSNPNQGKLT